MKMQTGMLDLVGGSGERPPSPNDPKPDPVGIVLTAEDLASLPNERLVAWYHDQLQYDSTPGRANTRLLREEIKRREAANAAWAALR